MQANGPERQDQLRSTDLRDGQYRLMGLVSDHLHVYDAMGRLQCTIFPYKGPGGTEPFQLLGLATGCYAQGLGGQWRGRVAVVRWGIQGKHN